MIIKLMKIVSFLLLMVAAPSLVISQGGYQSGSQPNGNETPCPNGIITVVRLTMPAMVNIVLSELPGITTLIIALQPDVI